MKNLTIAYRLAFLTTFLAGSLIICHPAGSSAGTVSGESMASGTITPSASENESVLERFRVYAGPRSKEALSELFTLPASQLVRQQPSIAISDGRTAVLIAVKVPSADGTVPNFAVEGAKMLSLERRERDEWLIKALPQSGALHVSLLIVNGPVSQAFPLTVTPPLPQNVDASSQEFGSFLETSDTPGPLHDLNGDGRHDYIDDYIYMANVLAIEHTSGRDLKSRRERALKRTLTQPSSPAVPGN